MKNGNGNSTADLSLSKPGTGKSGHTFYRGFISIDQEIEREIAMTFFCPSKKSVYSQKGFLFNKN